MIRTFVIGTLLALGMGGAAIAADAPTDPQIAHIAYTAGQIDIAAAEQAIKKSQNAEIIAFAKQMEEDHKAVNDQALALVKKLNVTPEDNPTSQALNKAAADKLHAGQARLLPFGAGQIACLQAGIDHLRRGEMAAGEEHAGEPNLIEQ